MRRKYDKNIVVWMILVIAVVVAFWEISVNKKAEECKDVYLSFLENKLYKEEVRYPEEVRYQFVHIDKDNVPELLLTDGNLHVSRVYLYTYDAELKQVKFLDALSSFGKLGYVPKKNCIISQYGNHGCYYTVYSEIENKGIKLNEVLLSDERSQEGKYYAGFLENNTFTGDMGNASQEEDVLNFLPEEKEEYEVSKELFEQLVEKWEAGKETVRYVEMNKL